MADIDLEKEFLDNRKRKKRAKLLGLISTSVLTAFVIISYLGYSVGTRLSNSTSIVLLDNDAETGLQEIGFRVSKAIPKVDQDKYGIWEDDHNIGGEGYVYWTRPSAGSNLVRYLVAHDGYTTDNMVSPVTSGPFKRGDAISIYNQPVLPFDDRPIAEQKTPASKTSYFSLNLILRVTRKQSDQSYVGVEDYGIYLEKNFSFLGDLKLKEALRFGFESNITSDIMSVGRLQAGTTEVGGRLDIDGDGYYDTVYQSSFHDSDPKGTQYELAYGDFLSPLSGNNWGEVAGEDIIPILGVDELDMYTAKTKVGARPFTDFIPAKQEYTTLKTYLFDGDSTTNTVNPIAITDTRGLAEIKIKIWLEGWDKSASDDLKGKTFGANLRFIANEIKRV